METSKIYRLRINGRLVLNGVSFGVAYDELQRRALDYRGHAVAVVSAPGDLQTYGLVHFRTDGRARPFWRRLS